MNKSDLKEWTRDMLESEIVNMNHKNFRLQNEVNNLRESNGRLLAQNESLNIQLKELENKYNDTKRKLEMLSDKYRREKTEQFKEKAHDEELYLLLLLLNYL